MVLHIIHKSDRTDRRQHIEQEMVRCGIDYVMWHEAITTYPKAHQNIGASHKAVIQYAKDNGLESICIAEDDVHFPSPDGWRYFLKKAPAGFGIYLGGAYSYRITIDTFAFNTCVIHKWSGMHLYIVANRFYDLFLQANTDIYNIEAAVKHVLDQAGKTAHICWPFAAVQAETKSDNIVGKIHRIKDYFNKHNTYGL